MLHCYPPHSGRVCSLLRSPQMFARNFLRSRVLNIVSCIAINTDKRVALFNIITPVIPRFG